MKKSIKFVLAKSMAVVMAFSLAGTTPVSADAAAMKPSITKKVTVNVGKTKTVKVKSKKKVNKTTWSLTKAGKKVVSLSKKKAKSVAVKGKKAGKATLTAKIKVGKKTYKMKCKITVKKNGGTIATPTPGGTNATSTPGSTDAAPTPDGTDATPTPGTGMNPGDPVQDITIDLSKCENTLFEGAPGSVDFSGQLDKMFDLSFFKELKVEYTLTFADGGDESLLTTGKIALVSDDDSVSANKLDGTSDGVSFTYNMVAGTSSVTIGIADKELTGKALGINVQPMDAGASYSWPESLQSVEITKLVFVAAEDAVYATPTPLPTAIPEPTDTPEPTPRQTFEAATQNYSYFNDYTLGYNGSIKVYKNGSALSVKDSGIKVYNQKTDNPFEQQIEGNDWWKDKITLTAPLQYTTNDGVAHDIDSMLTNFNFMADPTAIDNSDNDGKLYVYGTTEGFSYTKGKLAKNAYDNHSLTIVSTQDMVNWTDEGTLDNGNLTNQPASAASKDKKKCGWGTKAWAPSGLKIDGDGDGKDEYYIFYTNGGAVGYVQGDSPTGPWKDDLGKTLFDKNTPNCSEVEWCFDPAVLVDNKGDAYVYFGGGIRTGGPNAGNNKSPKTGRVCKIKFEKDTGKVLLDGEPKEMDTYYLFEDSEINQFNGKYCYSYCTNFSVADNQWIKSGQIAAYFSSDPMDISFNPETKGDKYTENGVDHHYLGTILDNPSLIYGESYNNHHHMQTFKGHDYIFYHATVLSNTLLRDNKQYRNLHVNEINVDTDKEKIEINPSYEGAKQIEAYNPFKNADGTTRYINATTAAKSAGVKSTRDDVMVKSSINGSPMVLDEIDTGDWTCIKGVDFGTEGLKNFGVEYAAEKDYGRIEMFIDSPTDINNKIASIDVMESTGGKYVFKNTTTSKTVTGKHDVYFVFRGAGYKVASWILSDKAEGDIPKVDRPDEPVNPNPPGTTIKYGWNDAKTEYRLPITDEYVKPDGGATVDVDDTEGTATGTFKPQYPGVWFVLPDDVTDAKFSSIEFTYKDATGATEFTKDDGTTDTSTFATATRYASSTSDEEIVWGGKFTEGSGTETFTLSSTRDFAKFKIFRNNCDEAKLTITSVVLKK